ncbi:recombination regulator RecX [Hafnia psychrotolerans]|uniref:Regulatory protein RecX n=1 Tax=Hafnia psychrotolerans TaxID=1477018 RepID=A0ABQ1GL21_9GAMM|nr:regulatory protein RecX [Hafnia psychrotolerans]
MSDDNAVNLEHRSQHDELEDASSLFSPAKEGDAGKINALISRAMRLLSQRDHGEMELRRKLLTPPIAFSKPSSFKSPKSHARKSTLSFSKEWQEEEEQKKIDRQIPEDISPEHVQSVIDYCYQHSWLDDAKFANHYISGRSKKGYGAQRIRSELQQKGVDKETIILALENSDVDWCALARDLAVRKFDEPLPTDWKEKSKVMRYLLSRGFFNEEIQSIYRDFDD